jgi:hypothetical protein
MKSVPVVDFPLPPSIPEIFDSDLSILAMELFLTHLLLVAIFLLKTTFV